jgi:hypothetical protein
MLQQFLLPIVVQMLGATVHLDKSKIASNFSNQLAIYDQLCNHDLNFLFVKHMDYIPKKA